MLQHRFLALIASMCHADVTLYYIFFQLGCHSRPEQAFLGSPYTSFHTNVRGMCYFHKFLSVGWSAPQVVYFGKSNLLAQSVGLKNRNMGVPALIHRSSDPNNVTQFRLHNIFSSRLSELFPPGLANRKGLPMVNRFTLYHH